MNHEARSALKSLILARRAAALGTSRDGAPLVSLVLYAVAADFSELYIHTSDLAHHTQEMLRERRVSLMIAEPETDDADPQTLGRVSLRGEASEVPRESPDYERIKAIYLARFPRAGFIFTLGGFRLFRIRAREARYVAGFGRVFDFDENALAALGDRAEL